MDYFPIDQLELHQNERNSDESEEFVGSPVSDAWLFSMAQLQETNEIDEQNGTKYTEVVKFYQFSEIKNSPLFVSWVEASLLGSLRETIERKSLTLEQWKAGKLAADWTDMIVKAR